MLCCHFFYITLYSVYAVFFFFFSSRRRHTRWPRDWSSDVCSPISPGPRAARRPIRPRGGPLRAVAEPEPAARPATRSEERRVGKEGRSRWGRAHEKTAGKDRTRNLREGGRAARHAERCARRGTQRQ